MSINYSSLSDEKLMEQIINESISTNADIDNEVGDSKILMEDFPAAIAISNNTVYQTQPATLISVSIPLTTFNWTSSLESDKSDNVEINVTDQSVSLVEFPSVISQTIIIYLVVLIQNEF